MTLFLAGLAAFAIIVRWLVARSQRRSQIMDDLLAARRYHARLWHIRAAMRGLITRKQVRS